MHALPRPRQKGGVCAICFRGARACVLLLLSCARTTLASDPVSHHAHLARPGYPIEYQDRIFPGPSWPWPSYVRQPQSPNLLAKYRYQTDAPLVQPGHRFPAVYAATSYGILLPAVQQRITAANKDATAVGWLARAQAVPIVCRETL